MEVIIELKISELNNFIKVLKKTKLLGCSLLWVNDRILPLCENENINRGKNCVFNPLDDLSDQGDIYRTDDVSIVLEQFNAIRGRKQTILYKRTPQNIAFTINEIEIIVASIYHDYDNAIDTSLKFADLLDEGEWRSFSNQFFEDMRDNKLITLDWDGVQVRMAKGVIPSIGVQQKSWGIKYSGRYKITSGNKPGLYILIIHMTFESAEVIHRYKFVSYK